MLSVTPPLSLALSLRGVWIQQGEQVGNNCTLIKENVIPST